MPSQELLYSFHCAVLPELHVVGFRGREALLEPYRFAIGLLGSDSQDVELGSALGARAALNVHLAPGRGPFVFQGIIASFELLHAWGDRVLYRAVLVPQLWQLGLTRHSRVLTGDTVKEAIEKVLKSGGLGAGDYRFDLLSEGEYKPREHTCQYQESDLAFLSRWMEREGLFYYFEHGDDREKLVVTDRPCASLPALRPEAVRYVPPAGPQDVMHLEALESFVCTHSQLPASVRLREYDYLNPSLDHKAEAEVSQDGAGLVSYFGDGYLTSRDGRSRAGEVERLARIRKEELLARQVLCRGRGRAFLLRTGYRFKLDEHPRDALNQEYLATEIEHFGNQSAEAPVARQLLDLPYDDEYRLELRAIPASVQYRPARRTPAPRVYGVVHAVVDGEQESDYAQIDEHGRYKVKIKFDDLDLADASDTQAAKASTWVRMLQPHAGSPEGFHFPLRKGTEVLLVFLGGDPDRPVICGAVPNAHTPSPVVAQNHTFNIIHTGGDNVVALQDQAGAQHVDISTPPKDTFVHLGEPHAGHSHYIVEHTDGNCFFDIGGDQDIEVGGDLTEHVVGNVTETYDAAQDSWVGQSQSLEVIANQEIWVHGFQSVTVDGAVIEKFNTSQATTVDGPETHTVTGTLNLSVTGAVSEKFDALHTLKVGGPQFVTVTGPVMETFSTNHIFTIGGPQIVTVAGPVLYTTPSFTIITPSFKVLPASWWKWAWLSGEGVALKLGLYGAKIEAGVVAAAVYGIKADVVGLKIDIAGAKYANKPIELGNSGSKLKSGGINLYMFALVIII
ncbi:MAG: type VI secretion system tip protein VgrG [Deltaproteobacteria bacterium]|nr:type VI secretion system tip protein VgrG [Deltaproteobacteria bacterium]